MTRRLLATAVVTLLLAMALVGAGALALLGGTGGSGLDLAAGQQCRTVLVPAAGAAPSRLDPVQARNVQVVVQAGLDLGLPDEALVVALATVLVESNARNLASRAVPASLRYPNDGVVAGDHDSVGLFQQRAGWGSLAERMDPATSARLFFTGGRGGQPGLLDKPWQSMSIGAAAQAVQVSAFPMRYAQRESEARAALAAVTGGAVADQVCDPVQLVAGPAGTWTSPVAAPRITSAFGYRVHPVLGYRKLHTGADFAAVTGTPLFAVAAGTVTRAGDGAGWGNYVRISHGGGIDSIYAHQCPGCIAVRVGQQVQPGQRIGAAGATGQVTGPHLHFEIRRDGSPIDPVPFLRQKGVPL